MNEMNDDHEPKVFDLGLVILGQGSSEQLHFTSGVHCVGKGETPCIDVELLHKGHWVTDACLFEN